MDKLETLKDLASHARDLGWTMGVNYRFEMWEVEISTDCWQEIVVPNEKEFEILACDYGLCQTVAYAKFKDCDLVIQCFFDGPDDLGVPYELIEKDDRDFK